MGRLEQAVISRNGDHIVAISGGLVNIFGIESEQFVFFGSSPKEERFNRPQVTLSRDGRYIGLFPEGGSGVYSGNRRAEAAAQIYRIDDLSEPVLTIPAIPQVSANSMVFDDKSQSIYLFGRSHLHFPSGQGLITISGEGIILAFYDVPRSSFGKLPRLSVHPDGYRVAFAEKEALTVASLPRPDSAK
jgi:hypothetical protein